MRSVWLSPRALGLHAAIVAAVPGFLWLGWWQLHRALAGNGLSWAYTFEWPFFSLYAVFMWWKLIHDIGSDRAARDATGAAAEPTPDGSVPGTRIVADPYDEELAAYNSYLASLNGAEEREPER